MGGSDACRQNRQLWRRQLNRRRQSAAGYATPGGFSLVPISADEPPLARNFGFHGRRLGCRFRHRQRHGYLHIFIDKITSNTFESFGC